VDRAGRRWRSTIIVGYALRTIAVSSVVERRSRVSRIYASVRMDFFVYSRDVAGTALRADKELLEEHWSYMDAFAESMIARGPTLAADRETATGSLHVLGLPGVDAAREFVAREPNNRAGVYADHFIWRFENLLGRTMWAFSRVADEPRFLIIARSDRDQSAGRSSRPVPQESLPPELRMGGTGSTASRRSRSTIGSLAAGARLKSAADALMCARMPRAGIEPATPALGEPRSIH
jgi:uncharacterized protein YciI